MPERISDEKNDLVANLRDMAESFADQAADSDAADVLAAADVLEEMDLQLRAARARVKELEAEAKRHRAALEWYAETDNYEHSSKLRDERGVPQVPAIVDQGGRARLALAPKERGR